MVTTGGQPLFDQQLPGFCKQQVKMVRLTVARVLNVDGFFWKNSVRTSPKV